MKKFLIILLAVILIVTMFAACRRDDNGDVTSSEATTGTSAAQPPGTSDVSSEDTSDVSTPENSDPADQPNTTASDTTNDVVVPVEFTVTFDSAGGSAVANATVEEGGKAAKPADPTKEGYTFLGWFTTADGDVAFDFDAVITADVTVFAQWEAETVEYTVTFDRNYEGAAAIPDVKVAEGGKVAKPADDPTRTGFRFDGWFTTADGDVEFDFDAVITADVTIFAQWTAGFYLTWIYGFEVDGEPKIEVEFIYTTPEALSVLLVNPYVTEEARLAVRPGYILESWNLGAVVWDFEANMNNRDRTLAAVWTAVHILSFDLNEGTGETPADQIVRAGGGGTAPEGEFTKGDLLLIGWFTEPDGGIIWDFDSSIVTEDMTLYARYGTLNELTAAHSSVTGFYEIVDGPRSNFSYRFNNEGMGNAFSPFPNLKLGEYNSDRHTVTFTTAFPVSVTSYVIATSHDCAIWSRFMEAWRFYGSVDGENWVLLDTQSGQAAVRNANNTDYEYNLNSPSAFFKYFRIHDIETQGGALQIGRIFLNGTYLITEDDTGGYFPVNFMSFSNAHPEYAEASVGGTNNSLHLRARFDRTPLTREVFNVAASNTANAGVSLQNNHRFVISNGVDSFNIYSRDNAGTVTGVAAFQHLNGGDPGTDNARDWEDFGARVEIRIRMEPVNIPVFIPWGELRLYRDVPDDGSSELIWTTGYIWFNYNVQRARQENRYNNNSGFFPAVTGSLGGDITKLLQPTDWFGRNPTDTGHGVSFIEHLAGHYDHDGSDPKLVIAFHSNNIIRNYFMNQRTADPGNGYFINAFMRFFIIVDGKEYEFTRIHGVHFQGLQMKMNSIAEFGTPEMFAVPERGTGEFFFYELQFRAADGVTVLGFANIAASLR